MTVLSSMTKIKLEEMELCSYCKGFGKTKHITERKPRVVCYNCNGKGLMLKITIIEYRQV